jgi:uncharacterized protein YqcC (DUF446 family)
MPDYESVEQQIGAIEAEMKRIGLWEEQPLEPEQLQFSRAFAGDTMAFHQWLQFVFAPRVHEILATHGTFPSRSQVAAQAVREFDGLDEAANLIRLLSEFDSQFNG